MRLRSRLCRRSVSWWRLLGLVAALVVAITASAPSMAAAPGYDALPTPVRLMDTRPGETTVDGQDAGIGLRSADSSFQLHVAGRAGIPADAETVVLNITAVRPLGPGYITAHARGTLRPLASNLNYQPGQIVNNTVLVPVGTGGDVTIYTRAATHLVVDATGSFAPGSTAMLDTAARLMDSRPGETTIDGHDAGIGLLPAGSSYELQVAGRAGIAADAETVVLNITAVRPLESGYLTAHARGTVRPLASNLNYQPGQIVNNTVLVRVGTGGDVTIYTRAATHLVVDAAGSLPAGTTAMLDAAARLVDTRIGETTIDGLDEGIGLRPISSSLQVHVAGRAGVPADATAAVLNITAVRPYGPGYVSTHPTGTPRSLTSNLNYQPGQIVGNTIVARIGAGGDVCIFTRAGTHLVVDVGGYLTGPPPPPAGPTCPPLKYGSPRPLQPGATVADVNNAGIVVGTDYHGSAADSDAVWWPTLDGEPQLVPGVPGDAWSSAALSVNDRNQALVSMYFGGTGPREFVVDLSSGHLTEFPGLDGVPGLEGLDAGVSKLNDRGEVLVAASRPEEGEDAVAVWDSTTGLVETHPELTSGAHPRDINDLGHVVGDWCDANSCDAFYWDRDTDVVHRLDHGGYLLAGAESVNDRGQVAGVVSDGSSESLAVFWSHRTAAPTPLPGPFASVRGLNEVGLVLGSRNFPGVKGPTPGVWDSVSGEWVEFPSVFGYSVHAINDVGQIVGLTGFEQPALWQPI